MPNTFSQWNFLEILTRVNQNFLWGSTAEKRKLYLVNWDALILPRDIGRLGLYASGTRNLPLLAKLNRRILTEADSLWASVLKPNTLTPVTPHHPGQLSELFENLGCL